MPHVPKDEIHRIVGDAWLLRVPVEVPANITEADVTAARFVIDGLVEKATPGDITILPKVDGAVTVEIDVDAGDTAQLAPGLYATQLFWTIAGDETCVSEPQLVLEKRLDGPPA